MINFGVTKHLEKHMPADVRTEMRSLTYETSHLV